MPPKAGVLADASVWIRHFREGDSKLVNLLHADLVFIHPVVWGELACGNLKDREDTIQQLRKLRPALIATDEEVLGLIRRHRLYGRGIGWSDAHLLASASLSGCSLWTLDLRLQSTASLLSRSL